MDALTPAINQAPVPRTELDQLDLICSMLDVSTDDELQRALVILERIKATEKSIEEAEAPVVKSAYAAYLKAKEFFSPFRKKVERCKERVTRLIERYRMEQREMVKAQERLMEETAAAQRDALMAEAKKLRAAGDTAGAQQAAEHATQIVAPVIPVPVVSGPIQERQYWEAEITDIMALLKAIVKGEVPIDCIDVKMTVLNKKAREMRAGLNWPGVRAVQRLRYAKNPRG